MTIVRRATLVVALTASLLVAALSGAQAAPRGPAPFPDVIALPDGFQPEGIAIGGTTAWLGSLADGDILAVDLRTGERDVLIEGPGTPSVGLTVDQFGRLFVAGGPAGVARVVDTRTGDLLASYTFASAPTFINDVIILDSVAWFTDSNNPVLYGLPLGPGGALPAPEAIITLELTGEYTHLPGFNLNGIERTPDGSALLAVQSASGLLYRIDPDTGVATVVDLGGYRLTNGDGLLVQGSTLYVVQNRLNQVAVFRLDPSGTSGVHVETLKSPAFDVPTTVARHGNALYLPNARFGTAGPQPAEYSLVRVER